MKNVQARHRNIIEKKNKPNSHRPQLHTISSLLTTALSLIPSPAATRMITIAAAAAAAVAVAVQSPQSSPS
jgi:hypothetical protein